MLKKEFKQKMEKVTKKTIYFTEKGGPNVSSSSLYYIRWQPPYTCLLVSDEFGENHPITKAYKRFIGLRTRGLNLVHKCDDIDILPLRVLYLKMFEQEILNTNTIRG